MKIEPIEYEWVQNPWDARVSEVVRSWGGTPYMAGQQCKQRAVDCLLFVTGCQDELHAHGKQHIAILRGDLGLHDREGAIAALRAVLEIYPGEKVTDGTLEAGDVVWTGPTAGGPSHGLIVSGEPGILYHAPGPGMVVSSTPFAFFPEVNQKLKVMRPANKEAWPC